MTTPVIELDSVWKTYMMGEFPVHALRGISVKVMPGEFVAIQGPSGSGKSTAMNMVGCLDVPTKGKVLLDGIDISTLHESELAQIRGRKIGFVFQKFNLIPTLSAVENVALPLSFLGVPRTERTKRAIEILTTLGLGTGSITDQINYLAGSNEWPSPRACRRSIINPCRRTHRQPRLTIRQTDNRDIAETQ